MSRRSNSNWPRPGAAGRTGFRRRPRPNSARPRRGSGCAGLKPFPLAYQALTQPAQAIADLPRIEKVLAGSPLEVSLHPVADGGRPGLRLYRAQRAGRAVRRPADARKSRAARRRRGAVPHRRRRRRRGLGARIPARRRPAAATAVSAAVGGASRRRWSRSGPGGSRTTASTAWSSRPGSSARQVTVLRLYAKVLRQAGSAFSQAYMEDTLGAHPDIAARLVRLFEIRFDPAGAAAERSLAAIGRGAGDRARARPGREPRRGPHPAQLSDARAQERAHQLLPAAAVGRAQALSRGQARQQRDRSACRCRGRCSRSTSTARGWRACTCAPARSRAAASAGPTARRISAPRSSG